MAVTKFRRFGGRISFTRPTTPKDGDMFVEDSASFFTMNVYDETNSVWKGIALTTSTSTSTSTTTTSTSTS